MPIQKDPEGIEILKINNIVDFSDRHVLEIGCGDGRLTSKYGHLAARVTAIDPDATALLTASSNLPANLKRTSSFTRASAIDLPFPAQQFDLALLSWSL
jgi:ubiquinone/menaquinone biosynthesis C-methylase UbiE